MLENYRRLHNGIIQQMVYNIVNYNESYAKDRYDSYGELSNYMSFLRYGYIKGLVNFNSILDIGYGNGDFLDVCKRTTRCYGHDISGYPIPEGCVFLDFNECLEIPIDVVTFFDSLEHFEDIEFVKKLNTKFVVISVPECHYFSDEWFKEWKHRRPDEHLYHFNKESLKDFMLEMGFELVQFSNVEDIIRDNGHAYSNILTGFFKNNK